MINLTKSSSAKKSKSQELGIKKDPSYTTKTFIFLSSTSVKLCGQQENSEVFVVETRLYIVDTITLFSTALFNMTTNQNKAHTIDYTNNQN